MAAIGDQEINEKDPVEAIRSFLQGAKQWLLKLGQSEEEKIEKELQEVDTPDHADEGGDRGD
jgi:hypothetical protein